MASPVKSSAKELMSHEQCGVPSNANPGRQHNKGPRPTTSKALALRDVKYASQEIGEPMPLRRMTGREKLDLLAENLMEESKKAIIDPLNLTKCLKMAKSQYDAYVDDITDLREADTFRDIIEAELKARAGSNKEGQKMTPSHIAKSVSTRIHNSYMLASAWRIVSETLTGLAICGLTDENAKTKLRDDPALRARYLVLLDIVEIVVKIGQDRFSVLATTAPYYAKFFKLKPTEDKNTNELEYVFDWKDLRDIANSFLDSVVIELCLPGGTYPKSILSHILRDAMKESPKEAERLPQELCCALGDLSITIELQELLEAPLLGPEAEPWKTEPRKMPEEYEAWVDAQIFSETASNQYSTFEDTVYPLEKTMDQKYLDEMWQQIDKNYIAASTLDINGLWHLDDALAYAVSNVNADDPDDKSSRPVPQKPEKDPKLLRLDRELHSDDSMPGPQSVSNFDDNDESVHGSEEWEYESENTGYNDDEEDQIRELCEEAMQAARNAEYLDGGVRRLEVDLFIEDGRKGNPFLKLLGAVRGRMFKASPKLKSEYTRTEPRKLAAHRAFRATPTGAPKNTPLAKAEPAPHSSLESRKAIVEGLEDEADTAATAAKKKKKTKKKNNPASAAPGEPPVSPSPSAQSMESPKGPRPPSPGPSLRSSMSLFNPSMASLSSAQSSTAQSAHSYVRSLGLGREKKVKSRSDHASLFSNSDKEKKGLFSSFKTKEKQPQEVDNNEPVLSLFSRLTKKSLHRMSQLLNTKDEAKGGRGGMKWDDFVRVMLEMGFKYIPSTAGSSVRFDPPDSLKNRPPITFHKPHPDPTLTPNIVRQYGKRLQRKYGWSDEHFKQISGNAF